MPLPLLNVHIPVTVIKLLPSSLNSFTVLKALILHSNGPPAVRAPMLCSGMFLFALGTQVLTRSCRGGAEYFFAGEDSWNNTDWYEEFSKNGYQVAKSKTELNELNTEDKALGIFSSRSCLTSLPSTLRPSF